MVKDGDVIGKLREQADELKALEDVTWKQDEKLMFRGRHRNPELMREMMDWRQKRIDKIMLDCLAQMY